MRQILLDSTHDAHRALHRDSIFRSLMNSGLSQTQYQRTLHVFKRLYDEIEESRVTWNTWHRFSVMAECAALERDLGEARTRTVLQFHSAQAVLGGLYVAHGAAFGRTAMYKSVQIQLPYASHAFLSLPMARTRWSAFLHCLECEGSEPVARKEIMNGAQQAFAAIAEFSADALDQKTKESE